MCVSCCCWWCSCSCLLTSCSSSCSDTRLPSTQAQQHLHHETLWTQVHSAAGRSSLAAVGSAPCSTGAHQQVCPAQEHGSMCSTHHDASGMQICCDQDGAKSWESLHILHIKSCFGQPAPSASQQFSQPRPLCKPQPCCVCLPLLLPAASSLLHCAGPQLPAACM